MSDPSPASGGAEPRYNDKPLGEWLGFLGDARKHVQKFAIDGLQEIGPEGVVAIPALTAVLNGKHADLRKPTALLLGRIGPVAAPALLAALQAPEEGTRQAAAAGLAVLGPAAKDAVAALRRALADGSAGVRLKAAEGLWAVAGDAAAVPVLINLIKMDNAGNGWRLRLDAVTALVKIGAPARPALEAVRDDPAETVRRYARDALRRIGPAKGDEAEPEESREPEQNTPDAGHASWLILLAVATVLAAFRSRQAFELLTFYWGVFVYETLYYSTMAGAALACRLIVKRVDIGSGPAAGKFRWRGIEFQFHLIPILGDVNWYSTKPRAADDPYESLSLWYNAAFEAVALVGQIGLAILILAGSWMVGRDDPAYLSGPAQVGWVRPGSALDRAGLKREDVIVKVQQDGAMVAVGTWRDLARAVRGATGLVRLEVERAGQAITLDADLDRPPLLDMDHAMPPRVVSVVAKSAAERLGIKPGDEIVAVDGKPTPHGLDVRLALAPPAGGTPTAHALTVKRKDQMLEFTVQPTDLEKGSLGLFWKAERGPRVALGPSAALAEAFREVGETWRQVWQWFTGQGEFARAYASAAVETDRRRPFFIAPEGFGSRVPVLLGLIGVLFTLYYVLSLGGTVFLAVAERVRKRSVPDWAPTVVDYVLVGAVVLWAAYRMLV